MVFPTVYSDKELRQEVSKLLAQWNQHFQQAVDSEQDVMETEDKSS